MWRIIQLVAALCVVKYGVVAFPSGAPNSACQTLTPDRSAHGSVIQSMDTFPYTVTCERTAPNMIRMRLGGAMFRGLLAQVRDGDRFLGTVQPPANNIDYRTTCTGSGVTHGNSNDKTNAEFNIMVPENEFSNSLSCVVTVVQTRAVYWIAHRTPLAQPTTTTEEMNASPTTMMIAADMNVDNTTPQQPDTPTNEPTGMTTEEMNAGPTTMMITADMNLDNTTPQQPDTPINEPTGVTTEEMKAGPTAITGRLNDMQRRNMIVRKLLLIRALLRRCIQRFGRKCRLLISFRRATEQRRNTQSREHLTTQPKPTQSTGKQ